MTEQGGVSGELVLYTSDDVLAHVQRYGEFDAKRKSVDAVAADDADVPEIERLVRSGEHGGKE